MATTAALEGPYPFSVARVLRAKDPKAELAGELVGFLRAHVNALGIHWSPTAFRAGLENPSLPAELLTRLEDFLRVAESLNWSLPKSVVETLDRAIEDVETFNPAFIGSLRASVASGRVPVGVVKKRAGA